MLRTIVPPLTLPEVHFMHLPLDLLFSQGAPG